MTALTSLDAVDKYISILSECRANQNLDDANRVHVDMCNLGLDTHPSLENYIVPLFVKCGHLQQARQSFDKLSHRNSHSWTALIHGYTENGHLQCALHLYWKMQEYFTHLCSYILIDLLKACRKSMELEVAQRIHCLVAEDGFEENTFVGSSLMDMYCKCGLLLEAQDVFNGLPERDIATWNVLIAGYTEHGQSEQALFCLGQLGHEGLSPTDITIVSGLRACSRIRDIDKGKDIFEQGVKHGYENNSFVRNTLVDMFSSCGLVEEAQYVFGMVPEKTLVTWNALISGYVDSGLNEEALYWFTQLSSDKDCVPDAVAFFCALRACSNLKATSMCQELHIQILVQGLERSSYINIALVDLYAKFGFLSEAQKLFDSLQFQDVVSWNALIAGYTEFRHHDKVFLCLEQMRVTGVLPDSNILISCLKACTNTEYVNEGQTIHAEIIKRGLEDNIFVGNTLLDMYGTCGLLLEAQNVFDKLPTRDVVSWNALIASYAENGLGNEALDYYKQMQTEGISPNSTTFVSRLKACTVIGAIEKGWEIHSEIVEEGYESDASVSNPLAESVHVSTALVDLYGKCGSMTDALDVFEEMTTHHLITWNALLSAYTSQGESEYVLQFFERMKKEHVQPDSITFLSVLTACCRTGSLSKGQEYFESMNKEYGIIPTIKHYNCIIDLLGRAGQIKEALLMVETMPIQPDEVTWNIVLSACQKWDNVDLGKQAFEHTKVSSEESDTAFVLMANIFSSGTQ